MGSGHWDIGLIEWTVILGFLGSFQVGLKFDPLSRRLPLVKPALPLSSSTSSGINDIFIIEEPTHRLPPPLHLLPPPPPSLPHPKVPPPFRPAKQVPGYCILICECRRSLALYWFPVVQCFSEAEHQMNPSNYSCMAIDLRPGS